MWVKRIVQLLHQRLGGGKVSWNAALRNAPLSGRAEGEWFCTSGKRQGTSRVLSGRRSRERLTQISPRKSSARSSTCTSDQAGGDVSEAWGADE